MQNNQVCPKKSGPLHWLVVVLNFLKRLGSYEITQGLGHVRPGKKMEFSDFVSYALKCPFRKTELKFLPVEHFQNKIQRDSADSGNVQLVRIPTHFYETDTLGHRQFQNHYISGKSFVSSPTSKVVVHIIVFWRETNFPKDHLRLLYFCF